MIRAINVVVLLLYFLQIYRGYVDDPRNTDNAWMETIAYNFHDETGESVGQLKLHAGTVCTLLLIDNITNDC